MERFNIVVENFNLFWVLITIVAALGVILGTCAYLILLERKIAAWVQDRKGPNRVGPWGLLQPIADGLKFLLKEEVIPGHVDRLFYIVGPGIAMATALLAFAVVPFGDTRPAPDRAWPQTVAEERQAAQASAGELTPAEQDKNYYETYKFMIAPGLDIGIVFVLAVGSLNVYAIILGGWSSNNKYSMLGSLRASAQVISYEIPMGMSVLGAAVLAGSLNLESIIQFQTKNGWLIFYQPLALLLFVTAIFAECNRMPFDLPECEQELVGGYHTEYSGMKFAMFFLGEYTHMITTSFLVMVIFFGGWSLFGLEEQVSGVGGMVLKLIILFGKMALFIVFYMLIRWTIPRFRFDQLMGLAWKVLLPLCLANLVAVLFVKQFGMNLWVLTAVSLVLFVGAAYFTLIMPAPPATPKPLRLRASSTAQAASR
jgi:NADH-quinone oxidoreductase subunit H